MTGSAPAIKPRTSLPRAVGVVRVSRVGDRSETIVSPDEQRQRIATACERDGLKLVETYEELDISGGAPLDKRPGLSKAVAMVEGGQAQTLVVAYLDRAFRALHVQDEVVGRVEAAGGTVLTVDVGRLSNGTASTKLSGRMLGLVAEYHRDMVRERTEGAKRRAIERGVPPYPRIPPGYRKGEGGRLEVDETLAPVVTEAFKMRASGATIKEVRAHLAEHGIERSFHGVQALLGSRIVLGELRFGDIVNEEACPAIVDESTWRRVQKASSPRGRRPKSDRLLARLGVLRCGTCGSRMVVGTTVQGGETYSFYRCVPTSDCTNRVTISSAIAETAVVEKVKELLAGMKGSASLESNMGIAVHDLEQAQAELDAAIRAFTGLDTEQSARDRLAELRAVRDEAAARVDELRAATEPALTVSVDDWDALSVESRRALIRATLESVTVAPGRGPDRITIHPRGQ